MNKKIFLLNIFAVLFILSVHSQLFWKISGNRLTKPSYLFGTHHLIDEDQIMDFDKILHYAGEADVVVGEMDMSDMLGMQIKMMKSAMMKDTTMKELLNDSDYILVDKGLKEVMGMGLNKLGKMKPLMLSAMYSVMIYKKLTNLKKEPEVIDILFQKKAKKNNKSVIGLETIEQQIDILFNSLPLREQAKILVVGIKDKENGVEQIKKLNEAYIKGDLRMIETLNNEDISLTPELKKIMVEERNNNWMLKLKTLLPEKSCFIAVGCMHLAGEKGLINQLKNSGYTVKAVENL